MSTVKPKGYNKAGIPIYEWPRTQLIEVRVWAGWASDDRPRGSRCLTRVRMDQSH